MYAEIFHWKIQIKHALFLFATQNSNEELYERASCCFSVWFSWTISINIRIKATSRGVCRDLKGTIEIEIEENSELFSSSFFLKRILSQGDLIHFSAKSEEKKHIIQ